MHYDARLMQFSERCLAELAGAFRVLKAPGHAGPPAQRDPAVIARVTEMLDEIGSGGLDAVLRYAAELDHWAGGDVELDPRTDRRQRRRARSGSCAPPSSSAPNGLRSSPREARNHLSDFETELAPGVRAGHRYVPVQRVGAYLPAGRFPILASAFMTVGVAKAAGVPTVLACTPPQPDGRPDPAVLYAAHLSGADRVYVLGGVQALAAMAFGLLGEAPVDMLVGAGNAYVTEAKRQLYGKVVDRPARRSVGGRRHRRRDRRSRDRRRRPARPGRARPRLAGGAGDDVGSVRPRRHRRGRAPTRRAGDRRRSPGRRGATTARSPGPPTRRRRRR